MFESAVVAPRIARQVISVRLPLHGLPGPPAGQQFVVLKIVTPAADSAERRALYEQMARTMPMHPRAPLERPS